MKNKLFLFLSLIVMVSVLVGLTVEDPWGSRSQTTDNQINVNTPVYVSYGTPVYTDDLDGANDTTALKSRGYKVYYRGTGAQGASATWYQGVSTVFAAFNGPATGYVASNYNVVTGTNNIDCWLVLPRLAGGILTGDSLFFYERSATGSTFPDSMRVMYSSNDSVPEGSWTELGRFKTNTTTGWQRHGYRASAPSANGRFAIRYCVVNGGPSGANSDYVGVDAIRIERTSAPVVRSWAEQTSGLASALYSVSAVSNDVAWICGAGGKVLRTTNKGLAWTNVSGNLPTTTDMYCVWGFDATTALVTGSPATGTFTWRTTNGGANWTQVFAETGGFIDGFHFLNATTGFMYGDPVGARWSLWKTVNGGANWDSTGLYVPSAGAAGWNNAMFGLGTHMWFGTNATALPHSGNSGATWANQTLPAANAYGIWFNSETVGLAGGSNLSVTTNGGTTWTALTSIGTGNISGITGEGSDWWFTRQSGGVNYSSNNGTSWAVQYALPGTGGVYYHLTKSRTGNTIWGVRSLGGISRYGEPITGITPISATVPDNFSLGQNYPNPFNPTTNIKFAVPQSGLVTVKVYDLLGKEIATLVNEVKNAGSYVVDFNASSLASGVYFYKMEVNGFRDVKRMTLIK